MSKYRMSTRVLVALALLSAINVVLARFINLMPSVTVRFSIEAVPVIIAGFVYGPAAGAAVGLVGDAAGCLFSPYGYNPVFSVPPMLIGMCAGLLRFLLYKRASYPRILASFLPAVVLGNVLWQSWWLSFFYGTHSFVWFLGSRAVQFAVTSLVNAAILYTLFRTRVFEMLRLWPPARARKRAQDTGTRTDDREREDIR